MTYLQNLFTSRDNNADGATYVGQTGRIWWDPVTNAFYYSDGSTPGGILITGGGSGNGVPGGLINTVQFNAGGGNFGGSPNLTFDGTTLTVDSTVVATTVVTSFVDSSDSAPIFVTPDLHLLGSLIVDQDIVANVSITASQFSATTANLGNLYIIDETIYGKNLDQDIVLSPRGDGYVSVPKLAIPVGSLIQDSAQVNPIIASLTLNQVIANSTGPGNTLPAGSYGNPGGVTHPWAVYQFTTVPSPILEVDDVIAGTGVPLPSTVQWVGNTSGTDSANANVVVTTGSYWDLPTPIPTYGNAITVTRALTLAGLNIVTAANTTLNLTPGTAGNIIAGSSIIPAVTNAFDLGTPTARWRSIYFGGATIYVFDPVLGVDQSISASNGNLIVGGGTGFEVGQFILTGNTIYLTNSAEDFNIGTPGATGNLNINRPMTVSDSGGNLAFQVTSGGKTEIKTRVLTSGQSALTVAATGDGASYPLTAPVGGSVMHATSAVDAPTITTFDTLSSTAGHSSIVQGRRFRGNITNPAAVQAEDSMIQLLATGYNGSGITAGIPSARLVSIAQENFTTNSEAAYWLFRTQVPGSVTPTEKSDLRVDSVGITFPNISSGGGSNLGITFQDGSFQNTAWVPNNNVNRLTAGAGITLSSSTGNITIGSTGVLGVNGTTNQISVANVGNVLTLSLPQNLNTTANVQLYSLTVNDLIILGNVSNVTPAVVSGKIVFVANTATNLAGINTSGLVTGNAANGFYAGILYNTDSNTWQMDIGNSDGITSNIIYSTEITANGNIHLGNAYNDYDFPNALLQGDINLDSYGQFVLKNHYQGANASADIVAVANNGDDSINYIDMGINSNVYANVDYAVTGFNDGYLYTNGGDLAIGTQTAGKVINLFTGGTNNINNIRAVVSNTALTVKNANVLVQDGSDNSIIELRNNGNIVFNGSQTLRVNSSGFYVSSVGINNGDANIVNYVGGAFVYGPALKDYAGNLRANNISVTSNVLVTGNISGGNLIGNNLTAGRVAFVGANRQITDDAEFTYNSTTNVLTVSNTIINNGVSTTGNVTGNYFIGNGAALTGVATFTTVSANGTSIVADSINDTVTLTPGNNIIITGNATTDTATFSVRENPTFTGNVTGDYFLGNGSQLTGVITALGNAFSTVSANGTSLIADSTADTVTLTPGNNIIITGNATTDTATFSVRENPTFTGNVTGDYFLGNGSQLTGVITTITPNALSSTVHVAAVTTGNTANIITDATTANTANTLVLRDANGAISVNGWTVGARLTAVNYTATTSDYWIGTTAKNKTITLPNAANGASTGRQYQIADTVHTGNPGTTIAAQSPATVVGNQPSQQGQIIIATYVGTTWYLN